LAPFGQQAAFSQSAPTPKHHKSTARASCGPHQPPHFLVSVDEFHERFALRNRGSWEFCPQTKEASDANFPTLCTEE
jgi:hypothetical protein